MQSPPRAVIAIGSNALIAEGQLGTIDQQFGNARRAARHIASLVAHHGWRVVERFLDRMTFADARGYLADGEFPEGGMGPKVRRLSNFWSAVERKL